jgi:hypothetical protein
MFPERRASDPYDRDAAHHDSLLSLTSAFSVERRSEGQGRMQRMSVRGVRENPVGRKAMRTLLDISGAG